MPFERHFFRSPSPPLQPTLGGLLAIIPPRPGPRAKPAQQRRPEAAGSRQMIGGPNEVAVITAFRAYQDRFKESNPLLIGDDEDGQVVRRCSYTREQKLAAIDFALNTWERRSSNGELIHISRYYVAMKLRVQPCLISRWIKTKHRILNLRKGAQRLRVSRVGKHPQLERKLNTEFEYARSIGRQITHRWFLR